MPDKVRGRRVCFRASAGEPAEPLVVSAAYSGLLRLELPRLAFRQDVHVSLEDPPHILLSKVARTAERGNSVVDALVVELLAPAPLPSDYDHISALLVQCLEAVRSQQRGLPRCIVLAGIDIEGWKRSLVVRQKLMPYLDPVGTALVAVELASSGVTETEELLKRRWRFEGHEAAQISAAPTVPEGFENLLDIYFGHFDCRGFHSPILVSFNRLAACRPAIVRLAEQIKVALGTADFDVFIDGAVGSGLEALATGLLAAANSAGGVFRDAVSATRSLAILRDVVPSPEVAVASLSGLTFPGRRAVLVPGAVLGAASRRQMKSVIPVASLAIGVSLDPCEACAQEVPLTPGRDLQAAIGDLREFDPFLFWSLVGSDTRFFRVDHWDKSRRTKNHYQFRIMTDPLFRRFSAGLATRLCNILAAEKQRLGLVDRLVCVCDEEGEILAGAMARHLRRSDRDVLRIPRELVKLAENRSVPRARLRSAVEGAIDPDQLFRRVVLIVDQAAHSLSTEAALGRICEAFEAKVLAFCVFLDRRADDVPVDGYMVAEQFVSLYSWQCSRPLPAVECPCHGVRR